MPGLVSALGSTVTSGIDSTTDSDLDVPNALLPVWQVSKPLASSVLLTAPSLIQESFAWNFTLSMPASTGATTNFNGGTYAAGPWRFLLSMITWSDTPFTFANGLATSLIISDPVNVTGVALTVHPWTANTVTSTVLDLEVVFPVQGWRIGLSHPGTGVGQNGNTCVGIVGRRPI